MLYAYDVPPREGRVRSVTEGQTRWTVTTECFDLNQAFTFDIEPGQKIGIGDYVEISGRVRMDPSLSVKTGEPVEKNLQYWHEPHDGSDMKNWIFFSLIAPKWKRVAPPDVSRILRQIITSTQGILDGWDDVSNESLHQTIQDWERASFHMRPILKLRVLEEQGKNAQVKALNLDL